VPWHGPHDGLVRSRYLTPTPHRNHYLASGYASKTTLVLRDPCRSGALAARSRRVLDYVLARVFGSSLDHYLAAGRSPESTRLLAARAQDLVSLASRRALARDWEHLLDVARRAPVPRTPRVPICRDRLVAAESDVREIVRRLRAPLPVAAQGVAAASVLLTDATGPLWNQRNHTPLRDALHAAIAQLDPAVPLFFPTLASSGN
jgi:hypothetical protein